MTSSPRAIGPETPMAANAGITTTGNMVVAITVTNRRLAPRLFSTPRRSLETRFTVLSSLSARKPHPGIWSYNVGELLPFIRATPLSPIRAAGYRHRPSGFHIRMLGGASRHGCFHANLLRDVVWVLLDDGDRSEDRNGDAGMALGTVDVDPLQYPAQLG